MSDEDSGNSGESVEEAVEDSGFVSSNTAAQKGKFSEDSDKSDSSDE